MTNFEGVDKSEGGWATDFAVVFVGIAAMMAVYHYSKNFQKSFFYFYMGQAVAHLFGGITHAEFSNRGADGVGQIGFYIVMTLGYTGTLMRVPFGLGLPKGYKITNVVLWVLLVIWSIGAIHNMEITDAMTDNVPYGTVKEGRETAHMFDNLYGFTELILMIVQVVMIWMWAMSYNNYSHNWNPTIIAVLDTISVLVVYLFGLYMAIFDPSFAYDASLMQRIYHYLQIFITIVVLMTDLNERAKQIDDVESQLIKKVEMDISTSPSYSVIIDT